MFVLDIRGEEIEEAFRRPRLFKKQGRGLRADIGQTCSGSSTRISVDVALDIDGPHLNAVPLPLREPLEAGKTRRHKEQVAMMFGPGSQLFQIDLQLFIVLRIDCGEGFRAHQARRFAHNVEFDGGVRAGSQYIAACVRVHFQQMAGGGQGNDIRPGLIDLFNEV